MRSASPLPPPHLKSHSSVERAALIGGVMIKMVPTDGSYAVTGAALQKMVDEDKAAGLIPFYVRPRRAQSGADVPAARMMTCRPRTTRRQNQ